MKFFYTYEEWKKIQATSIEFVFCEFPNHYSIKEIVSVNKISKMKSNKKDYLYVFVDDFDLFFEKYGNIITGGIYNNKNNGPIDMCGINYYSLSLIDKVIKQIEEEKPDDYETILSWLEKAKQHNGFYIFGI